MMTPEQLVVLERNYVGACAVEHAALEMLLMADRPEILETAAVAHTVAIETKRLWYYYWRHAMKAPE